MHKVIRSLTRVFEEFLRTLHTGASAQPQLIPIKARPRDAHLPSRRSPRHR